MSPARALELSLREGYLKLRHSNCWLVGRTGNLLKALSCKLGVDHADHEYIARVYFAALDAELSGEVTRLEMKRGWDLWPQFMEAQKAEGKSCTVLVEQCKLRAMSLLYTAFDDEDGGSRDVAAVNMPIKIDRDLRLDHDRRGKKVQDFEMKVNEFTVMRQRWGRRMGEILQNKQLGESERITLQRAVNDEFRHELLSKFDDPKDVLDINMRAHALPHALARRTRMCIG